MKKKQKKEVPTMEAEGKNMDQVFNLTTRINEIGNDLRAVPWDGSEVSSTRVKEIKLRFRQAYKEFNQILRSI